MPKNVLVADDSLTMRKVISLVLAPDDFRLIEVDNGMDAIAKAQEINPDMVMADGSMPGKDGFEVCLALKKNPKTAHVPILLLVNGQEPIDEAKLRSTGADAYIAKPFESQVLLDTVCSMLKMPLVAPLPMRGASTATASKLLQPAGPSAPSMPAAPVLTPAPPVSAPVVPPPPPASAASVLSPPAPASPPVPASPPAPVFAPPLSAATELSPAFVPPARAAAPASLTPAPFSMSAASMGEPAPRVAPVAPQGIARRAPGAPIFGSLPASPPQPAPSVAPVIPGLQATAVPMSSSPRPFAPAFPPARAAASPPYAARPQPPYGAPASRPLPLTQQLPRAAAPSVAPLVPRAALPLSRTPSPVPSASPSLFPPAGRAAPPPSPSSYRPPYARAPMQQQAVAGGLMRRDDPFGLRGHMTPAPPAPSLNPEAALRELLPSISKELLEKVIWEVVPQLAETMMREYMERFIQAKERGEKR